jgi:predicted secreted protein
MSFWSGVAVYFIIWWVVLFAVLPWGVQNAHEAGETVETGNEPGAPVNPRLVFKALVTTVISAIIFAIVYLAIASGWLLG